MAEEQNTKPKWVFKDEEHAINELEKSKSHPDKEIKWTASEFIHHHKSFGWYFGLIVATALVASVTYLLTKDTISTVTIVVVGLLFGVLGSKKPRQLPYIVNGHGISIGPKFYPYTIFQSFAVAQDGAIASIDLMPLKRFMPEISVYFPPDQGDKILEVISDHLPHEQKQEHAIDRLMKNLRF